MRGQPETLGKIYALLAYKANSQEKGMDQQQIAKLVDRSVSTVSRLLNELETAGFCRYTEIINKSGKRERKYFMLSSTKEIAKKRFRILIEQNEWFIGELSKVNKLVSESGDTEEDVFLQHLSTIEVSAEKLNTVYKFIIHKIEEELVGTDL